MGAAGSSTAAIAFGGSPDTTDTETWNGSSWTEITAMNTARGAMGPSMAGTTTAVLGAGGANGGVRNLTEQWNGSSWTEVGDINTTRYSMAGAGTVTSALIAGGYDNEAKNSVETWNGSNWTDAGTLNTGRYNFVGSGVSNTSALVFGGQPGSGPGTGKTELWTGSSFSEQNDRNTAVVGPASSGTATSALGFGGEGPPALAVTESWSVPSTTTKTVSTD